MKKVKKIIIILLIIIAALALLVFGGRYALIKTLSKNATVNEIVDKAADYLNDEQTQQKIDNMVQQMIEEGSIAEQDLSTYIEYTEKAQATPSPAILTEKPKKQMSRTERILNAMTPSDAAFARSMYGKINLSYAIQLLNTDRPAAKEYIKSCLTKEEISKSLAIYSKYAYLLKEIK